MYLHLCTYYYGGPHGKRLRYIVGMFLLAFVLTPFNLSAMGYLIFAFFSVCVHGSDPLVVAHHRPGDRHLHPADLSTWPQLQHHRQRGHAAIIFGIVAVYTGYTTSQQAVLRRSKEEIMRLATLAERERIGRDLHDLLGHTLSVVALKSELARRLIDRDIEAARIEITEVERVARDSLAQVRNAVAGIRNTALSAEIVVGHGAARGPGPAGQVRDREREAAA